MCVHVNIAVWLFAGHGGLMIYNRDVANLFGANPTKYDLDCSDIHTYTEFILRVIAGAKHCRGKSKSMESK